jgi:hypothetical protein
MKATMTTEELKKGAMNGTISDDANPLFAFSTMPTELIVNFVKGVYDIDYFLRSELAQRGLNINGQWIGFEAAKKEHKI